MERMILRELSLLGFRNFGKRGFAFSSRLTLVVGANASGKTNLLEAIYLLARGSSFRGGKNEEMISQRTEMARVKGVLAQGEGLEVVLTRGEVNGVKTPKKRHLLNGVAKRMMDFVGQLKVVVFRPEDLEIVIDSPSIRREYLDSVLEQVDREYRRASLSYQKGVRQRNRLLEQIREGERERAALFFWNKLLVENGRVLTSKREEYIDYINDQPDYFGDLEIEYDKSIISPERLEKYKKEEVAVGMTLVGPHRDDFKLGIRSARGRVRDLHVYGSRGEQRLAVFSLKLAELEFMAEKTGKRPLLLLDDIFSELDEGNRRRLLEVMPKQQTILTATDLGAVEKGFREKMEIMKIGEE